ncbi:MAG: hypothetical protein H0T92_15585 [Pyrinomonadaceae bacterium]|nr:hypothetical protein [Pyrinomonadaceae bacterium]
MRRVIITAVLGIAVSLFAASYTQQVAAQQVRYSLRSSPNLEETREVILATRRNHRLHFFDAATLEPLGYFAVNNLAHTVSASPDGRKLFIEQAETPEGNGCCALFALDLATGAMCKLTYPSSIGIPTADGRRLITQPGGDIDFFDAKTLARMPRIVAQSAYRLYPSPDSRWLFGITTGVNGQGPSLDIFDLKQGMLVRRLPFPKDLPSFEKLRQATWTWPDGAWLGDHFYLYAHDGKQGNLWPVTPGMTTLSSSIKPPLPVLAGVDQPILHSLLAAGERLFLYEQFGTKIDRRRNYGEVTGGLFVIEPRSGRVVAHLAPSIEFARLIVSPDGRRLYGIDSGPTDWRGPVRLLQLDATSGAVITERTLEDDVWFISLATLPKSLVPNGEVRPIPCQAREQ